MVLTRGMPWAESLFHHRHRDLLGQRAAPLRTLGIGMGPIQQGAMLRVQGVIIAHLEAGGF